MRFASSTSWAAVRRHLADVLEEELERVGRDLGLGALDLDFGLDLPAARWDDGDLRLVERCIELVELARLELQLVQGERDLVRVEASVAEPALEQALRFVGREYVSTGARVAGPSCFVPPKPPPCSSERVTR